MDSTAFIEKLRANLYTNLRKQGSMTGDDCSAAVAAVESTMLDMLIEDGNVEDILSTVLTLTTYFRNVGTSRYSANMKSNGQKDLIEKLPKSFTSKVRVVRHTVENITLSLAVAKLSYIDRKLTSLECDEKILRQLSGTYGSMEDQLEVLSGKMLALEHTRLSIYEKFPQLSDIK